MKTMRTGFVLIALAQLAGCTQGTPGGPGAIGTTANKPILEQSVLNQSENTFNLSVPIMATTFQAGTRSDVTIGIKRAVNFGEDVAITFTNLPQGLTVEPMAPVIKHGDKDITLTLVARDDVRPGDFKVNVIGHPEKGSNAEVAFKVSITAMDGFTLSVPRLPTSVKQGQSETISIGVNRENTFDRNVSLRFSQLPMGVTVFPAEHLFEPNQSEAEFVLTAADDAALGSFKVSATGHPAKGADAENEFRLTVLKNSTRNSE